MKPVGRGDESPGYGLLRHDVPRNDMRGECCRTACEFYCRADVFMRSTQ